MFITFEGIEGCGKSTQAKLMSDFLSKIGYNVLLTREPGGPPISEKIRHILLDNSNTVMLPETELLLYMASRAQHTGELILPSLKEKKIVICDRYYDSSLAYQGAGRDLANNVIKDLIRFSTFGLVPDCTILLDIAVETGVSRMSERTKDRLESEDLSFHKKVRNAFIDVAKSEPERYIVVNGDNTEESIHNEIKEYILKLLKDGKK